MLTGWTTDRNRDHVAPAPWGTDSDAWRELDRRLPADHLARRIARAVDRLDLTPLWASYLGVGRPALRPDLLLKVVVYETHSNRPSPAQWAKDVRESEPVRWLLFGLEPSRARLYAFRDRLAPFWDDWNAQVLRQAVAAGLTAAARASLDSSTVAAHASRRRLLNAQRLHDRQRVIDEYIRGEPDAEPPGWLGKTEAGRRAQKRRYAHAASILDERLAANAQRPSSKRRPAEKVVIGPADPAAALACDKDGVFRPLYLVQVLRDLDSPVIFASAVLAQNNDNGAVPPLVDRMVDAVGVRPTDLLVDSGYVSVRHLEFCAAAGISLYGPCQANDFSAAAGKKAQTNQHTELPKSAFTWRPEDQTYQCPEGHRLVFTKTQTQPRADHKITLSLYTCPAEHCQACPRQAACTKTPAKGRTVSRMENEDLLDALRERMQTPAAKALYKQRSRTVELNFADLKEHRGLRRFHGRGLDRVTAEVGSQVLTHNLLAVAAHADKVRPDGGAKESPQTLWSP